MNPQIVATNREAWANFFILDKLEAGLVLNGSEVKSIRDGKVNLKDAYVRFLNGEAFVIGMHVNPYSHTQDRAALDPTRTRKLLLKQSEINHLLGQLNRKGLTCVPLSLYFKRGIAKLEIGIGQGKKQHDKRETIRKRVQQREMRQALKRRSK